MSDEELLELLKDAIENSKNTSEMFKEVAQIQRECYRELIKCKEKTMEQQNMITALEIEVKNLKEIVSKLEEKK